MAENLYTPDSIRTRSGKYVNVFAPDPNTITIEDIAHGLSHMPRFAGHLPYLYSVGQHSIRAAEIAEPDLKLTALLHDASEAFLMDIPKPIKMKMPEYNIVEDQLMSVIAKKFGFQWPMPDKIKAIDKYLLEDEWFCLMLENVLAQPRSPEEVRNQFLRLFKHLTKNVS